MTTAEPTGHAGDDRLLAILAERGDLTAPRHWLHFLTFADEESARRAETEIAERGWETDVDFDDEADENAWEITAERGDAVVSSDTVRTARMFFEGVAQRTGGEYDGWEASLN